MSDREPAARDGVKLSVSDDAEIVFDEVSKYFIQGGQTVWACKELTFSIKKGELVAVVGKTGCGKSTAFNMILGLLQPTSGRLLVKGKEPRADFDAFRGKVAVVFQEPRLLPWRTAIDNVALGLEYSGVEREERYKISREWLRRLGLAGSEDAYPYQLSGGMKQRVGIARCFAVDPDIILCDESFSALDEVTADALREEFKGLVHDYHKTGLFITHSIEEALTVGQRVLVFRAPGHVAAEFPATDVLDDQALAEYRRRVRQAIEGPNGEPAARSASGSGGQEVP